MWSPVVATHTVQRFLLLSMRGIDELCGQMFSSLKVNCFEFWIRNLWMLKVTSNFSTIFNTCTIGLTLNGRFMKSLHLLVIFYFKVVLYQGRTIMKRIIIHTYESITNITLKNANVWLKDFVFLKQASSQICGCSQHEGCQHYIPTSPEKNNVFPRCV